MKADVLKLVYLVYYLEWIFTLSTNACSIRTQLQIIPSQLLNTRRVVHTF